MKSMKYMVVALVAAIALLGVGYAQWTDSVVMTDTVSTGYMDVKVEKVVAGQYWLNNKYVNVQPNWDDNTATVTISNMFPGGFGRIDALFTNNSTVPIELKNVKFDYVSGDGALYNALTVAASAHYNPNGKLGTNPAVDYLPVGATNAWITGGKISDPTTGQAFANAFNKVQPNGDPKVVIKPQGQLGFYGEPEDEDCLQIGLPADADNSYQSKTCTFTITFNFDQTLPPTQTVNNPANGNIPTWYWLSGR